MSVEVEASDPASLYQGCLQQPTHATEDTDWPMFSDRLCRHLCGDGMHSTGGGSHRPIVLARVRPLLMYMLDNATPNGEAFM